MARAQRKPFKIVPHRECAMGSNQDPIAMVNLVLDDLCRPAGKGLDAGFAVHGLVLHLDALPALCFPHALQGKTALLGFVLAGLFQDDRVEQH